VTLVTEDLRVHVVVAQQVLRVHKESKAPKEPGVKLVQGPEVLPVPWDQEENAERWVSKASRETQVHLDHRDPVDATVSRVTVDLLVQWVALVCADPKATKV